MIGNPQQFGTLKKKVLNFPTSFSPSSVYLICKEMAQHRLSYVRHFQQNKKKSVLNSCGDFRIIYRIVARLQAAPKTSFPPITLICRD
jgi:hypothetical protein